jgi:hypothetical protein
LSDWGFRKRAINQLRCGLDHSPGATTGAEATKFAGESNQVAVTPPVTLDPKKPMLQKAALWVLLEFLSYERRQIPA